MNKVPKNGYVLEKLVRDYDYGLREKFYVAIGAFKSSLRYVLPHGERYGNNNPQWPDSMDKYVVVEYEVVEKRRRSVKDFMENVLPLNDDDLQDALVALEEKPGKYPVIVRVASVDVPRVMEILDALPLSSDLPKEVFLRGNFYGFAVYEDPMLDPGIVLAYKSARAQQKFRL